MTHRRIIDENNALLEEIIQGKFVQVRTQEGDQLVLGNLNETRHAQILTRFLNRKSLIYTMIEDSMGDQVPQPNGDSYSLIGAGSYEVKGKNKKLTVGGLSSSYGIGPEIPSLRSIVDVDLPEWRLVEAK